MSQLPGVPGADRCPGTVAQRIVTPSFQRFHEDDWRSPPALLDQPCLLHLIDGGQAATLGQVSAHIDAGDTISWLSRVGWPAGGQSRSARVGAQRLLRVGRRFGASLEEEKNAVEAGDVAVKKNGLWFPPGLLPRRVGEPRRLNCRAWGSH